LASDSLAQKHPPIFDLFNQACHAHPLPGKILKAVPEKGNLKQIPVAQCAEQNGQVLYRGKRYVPEGDELRLRLIQEHHDTALARHPGKVKTYDLLDREYDWKEMQRQVDQYVRNCHSSQ